MGSRKFWTISYADGVALIAIDVTGLKIMIRRYKRYLRREGL